jgi:hypothetical protein
VTQRDAKKVRLLRRLRDRYTVTESSIARILGVKAVTARKYAREMVKEGKLFVRFVEDGVAHYAVTEENQ